MSDDAPNEIWIVSGDARLERFAQKPLSDQDPENYLHYVLNTRQAAPVDVAKALQIAKSLNRRECFADSALGLEASISFDEIIQHLEGLLK